jgi:hypothetical protein
MKDCQFMKEECFQDISSESRILDVVSNEEKDESILILETPHPIKDINIIEQPIFDYIETLFQRIVGQTMQSYFEHIGLVFFQYTLIIPLTLWYQPRCVPQFWSSFHESHGCLNGFIGNLPTPKIIPFLQVG